jgi:hypothetical protein
MDWYKHAQEEPTKEMVDWFDKRTSKHIKLVQKYCKKIFDYDPDRFGSVVESGKKHDASKYKTPEHGPYVYITWQYKQKDAGKDFQLPDGTKEAMNDATEHHVGNNRHHPEFHDDVKGKINREDRDKPPEKKVDASKMPDEDVAEMVADWCAMSEEKSGTPKKWAKDNIGKRWVFTDDQEALIYELIDAIWEI